MDTPDLGLVPADPNRPAETSMNDWVHKMADREPTAFNVNVLPTGDLETKYGVVSSETGETLQQAWQRVKAQRQVIDPDYVAKQLDGVIAPKPFISPEHYHISYECDGYTFPHTKVRYKKSREAYQEIFRMSVLSKPAAVYFEDGLVRIWTPITGRTGVHSVYLRVVMCMLKRCGKAENPVVLRIPSKEDTGDLFRPASERLSTKDIYK